MSATSGQELVSLHIALEAAPALPVVLAAPEDVVLCLGGDHRQRHDLHVGVDQRAPRQRPVLLEVQQLLHARLSDERAASLLERSEARRHLLDVDDGEQAVVPASLDDDLAVPGSVHLRVQRILRHAPGVLVLVVALRDCRVRQLRELALKPLAVGTLREGQQWKNVGHDADAPVWGELRSVMQLAVCVNDQHRVGSLVLVAATEGAAGLVDRLVLGPRDEPLRAVLQRLVCRSAACSVERPATAEDILTQHPILALVIDLPA
mmetsp:Transcript_61905/g.195249  ORF Transcript_61905/g.195249 Transcript_61905/m.195249 type:complete len:263 (+) Transcript_61905:498-1286(+)